MRFRKLRIMWSVAWGLACVLLIALWVRTYAWNDIYTPQCEWHTYNIRVERWQFIFCPNQLRKWLSGRVWFWRTWLAASCEQVCKSDSGFEWRRSLSMKTIKVPFWFLTLSLSICAGLPWVHWRFSLRTLLIATTLVAVVLGLVVYATR